MALKVPKRKVQSDSNTGRPGPPPQPQSTSPMKRKQHDNNMGDKPSASKGILKRGPSDQGPVEKKRRSIQFSDKPQIKGISPRAVKKPFSPKVRVEPRVIDMDADSKPFKKSFQPKAKPKPNPKNEKFKQAFQNKQPHIDLMRRQEKLKELSAQAAGGDSQTQDQDQSQPPPQLTAREARLQAKELRLARRMKKRAGDLWDISAQLKKIWEDIRPENTPKERVAIGLARIVNAAEGKVKQLLLWHDTSRVLEFVIAHNDRGEPVTGPGSDRPGGAKSSDKSSPTTLRDRLFSEVSSQSDILELSASKYSSFFIVKMLGYGTPEQKELIIKAFYGKVKKYLRHSIASKVIETIYNEVANAARRSALCQEYYGPQYTLFKDENASLENLLGESSNLSSAQKSSILDSLREELTKLTDKSVVKHSLVHFLLRQYFKFADLNSKRELIEQQLRPVVCEILHTKDGSRVAMDCFRYGSAKDRKAILKSFKGVVGKIAAEEEGHLVLLTALDTIDDTVLLHQLIIQELLTGKGTTDVTTIVRRAAATDKYATRVCHYLLSPRNTQYFHPQVVKILEESDGLGTVKKPRPVREQEIKRLASPHLLALAVDFAGDMLTCPHGSLLLPHILSAVELGSDRQPALAAVAAVLAKAGAYEPYTAAPPTSAKGKAATADESALHIIERNIAHRAFKKIFASDALRRPLETSDEQDQDEPMDVDQDQQEEKSDAAAAAKKAPFVSFASVVIENIKPEVLFSYAQCNRGTYFLLDLFRACRTDGTGPAEELVLKAKKELSSALRVSENSAARLLLEFFSSIK